MGPGKRTWNRFSLRLKKRNRGVLSGGEGKRAMVKRAIANLTWALAALSIVTMLTTVALAEQYKPPGPNANMVYELTVSDSAFSALSINSAKTFDAINVGGYHTVLVQIIYTFASGTAVNMTCQESSDNSNWFQVPQADESSPPTVSHAQRIWTWPGTASVNFYFEVPVRYRYLKCSIYTTGGGAGDTASVSATVAD